MVAFTRCPYCGHAEVEFSASACPICDGELAQDNQSSTTLGSLRESTKGVDLKDLLGTPKRSKSEEELELAIDLASRAHTLEDVRMSDLLDLDLDQSKSAMPTPVATTTKAVDSIAPPVQSRTQSRLAGLSIYLYLAFFVVAVLGFNYLDTRDEAGTPPERSGFMSESERLGMAAIEQGRYAAAIKLLERAMASEGRITLLPSLALAYSQTSQIERSRQVMRTYRLALQKNEPMMRSESP